MLNHRVSESRRLFFSFLEWLDAPVRPRVFVSRTREKLGRTCDQIGRTLEPCLTFLGSLDFSEHFNQMLSKSGGDKISHFKKWWGHVPSVPSVNDTYASDSSPSVNIWRRQKLKQIQQEDVLNSNTIESIIHYNASSSEKAISSESIILNL